MFLSAKQLGVKIDLNAQEMNVFKRRRLFGWRARRLLCY